MAGRAAAVPAEVVQLVADVRHRRLVHDPARSRRRRRRGSRAPRRRCPRAGRRGRGTPPAAPASPPAASCGRRRACRVSCASELLSRSGGRAARARRPGPSSLALFEQRGDQRRRARGAVGLDRPVVDRRGRSPRRSRRRSSSGPSRLEVHAAAGAVALEPVADVEVLLEVVARAGSRGTAVGSRSAPSTSSARPARRRGRRRPGAGRGRARTRAPRARRARGSDAGSMRGPATTIMRSVRHPLACASGYGVDHPPQQVRRRRPSRRR